MQALLRCPHGQETGWENQQGMRVYRHIADGSTCGLLNGLLVTPEELMLERCRRFLQHRRFIAAAELVEYAERLQVAGSRRQRQEIHEFLLCFHASLKARELIYKTLQEFVLTDGVQEFRQLFKLVALAFSYPRCQKQAREYKSKVKELLQFSGAALMVLLQMIGAAKTVTPAVQCFCEEAAFQLRYEFFPAQEKQAAYKSILEFAERIK